MDLPLFDADMVTRKGKVSFVLLSSLVECALVVLSAPEKEHQGSVFFDLEFYEGSNPKTFCESGCKGGRS